MPKNVEGCRRRPARKLLFIAYSFPPLQSSASNRTWNIAKHLTALDWSVTVVTPATPVNLDQVHSVDEDAIRECGIERILTRPANPFDLPVQTNKIARFRSRCVRRILWQCGIESTFTWKRIAVAACRNLKPNDVDLILATGPPYLSFKIARQLSRQLDRPYVLDYRDAWTADPLVRKAHRRTVRLEGALVQEAAKVVAVSEGTAQSLDRKFRVSQKTHVVSNGFDACQLASVNPYRFEEFAIVYTGILFSPTRMITPVMAALRILDGLTNHDNLRWRFHYYGPDGKLVLDDATRFGIAHRTVDHGLTSHAETLSAVRGANVALVINSTSEQCSPGERGVIPGKIFEAVGLGTPIMLISPPNSDVRSIIREDCESQAFTGRETCAMAKFLLNKMQSPASREHRTPNDQYSWPNLAKKLNIVLCDAAWTGTHTSNRNVIASV
ncbi:MAG: glycosyltransferase [Pirellulaceae bacterium]